MPMPILYQQVEKEVNSRVVVPETSYSSKEMVKSIPAPITMVLDDSFVDIETAQEGVHERQVSTVSSFFSYFCIYIWQS